MDSNTFAEARALLEKRSFVPMPAGQAPMPPMDPTSMDAYGSPPVDPAMMGGAPGGAPMDPAMMGGAPMDPAMMGGAPMAPAMMGGAPSGMPMDPSMMGGEPMIGELPVSEFQALLADTIMQVLTGGGQGEEMPGEGEMPPEGGEEGAPSNTAGSSNAEIMERLGTIEEILTALLGAGGEGAPDPSMMGGAPGGMPMDPSMMGGAPGGMPMDPSMMGGAPGGMPGQPGLEVSACARPKPGLADMLVNKVINAHRG